MYRPAGMSSDEYNSSDYDDDIYPSSRKNYSNKSSQRNPEEEFISATAFKEVEKMKQLLDEGVNVNYKPTNGWNALLYAASEGNFELLKLLIDRGADVNSSHEKCTPLLSLCGSSSKDEDELLQCLDLLLEHGASTDVTDWYRVSGLTRAVKMNHERLVLRLLNAGCNINQIDQDGWSPIFYAADAGNINLVGILKDQGANLYAVDKRGRTLLEIAAAKDYNDIIELISGNRDIIIQDTDCCERPFRKVSSYQFVLSEYPNHTDRLSGFPTDVRNIITGIGLGNLNKLFNEHNIHLGHLLTITDEKLKLLGVHFWFDRKRILRSINKFHEYPWNISSFGNNVLFSKLDIFHVAQVLSNLSRQLYIVSTTVYHWNESKGYDSADEETLRGILSSIRHNKRTLKKIEKISSDIDKRISSLPSDLILPEKGNGIRPWKIILYTSATVFILYKVKTYLKLSVFFKH